MPNLATALKDEICRLSRKEVRKETGVTKRASVQHRRDIAELKRLVDDLSKRVAFLERQEKRRVAQPVHEKPSGQVRFSPRWVKAQRERLGLSAADYGRLAGVSALSVYNWERGRSKPREDALARLAALRGLGKREALRRLDMLEG